MPEIKPLKTIHQSFMELPDRVRDWLTSERVTYTIIEINKKLDLFGNLLTVIPNLITKLVTKNLDPKSFTKELEDGLGLDAEQAQEITREIVEKILRPVDLPLKQTEVFIGLIYGAPAGMPAPKPPAPPAQPSLDDARPTEAGRPVSPIVPPAPRMSQRPVSPPPVPPTQSRTPLIATKEMAHPEEVQNKTIPIPIRKEGSEGNRVIG